MEESVVFESLDSSYPHSISMLGSASGSACYCIFLPPGRSRASTGALVATLPRLTPLNVTVYAYACTGGKLATQKQALKLAGEMVG